VLRGESEKTSDEHRDQIYRIFPQPAVAVYQQERTGYGLGKFQSSEDVAKARGAAPWTRALPISHGKSAGLLRAGPTW